MAQSYNPFENAQAQFYGPGRFLAAFLPQRQHPENRADPGKSKQQDAQKATAADAEIKHSACQRQRRRHQPGQVFLQAHHHHSFGLFGHSGLFYKNRC
mgnify:CR=1 FL=1